MRVASKDELIGRIKELRAENERLNIENAFLRNSRGVEAYAKLNGKLENAVEALEFYASMTNVGHTKYFGRRARQVLKDIEGEND